MMRKLYRSQQERMVAGVCGGIGETYDVDPTVIRLVVAFVGIFTGFIPMLLAYLMAYIIIPQKNGS